ncbi:unnamed protein product [Phytophthora fragariaefolia]|uniref:Unnamed protein product n=1 Tax=Phytophthora fragariaefolia TaxID=1490495 RepID=A0A9W6X7M4_9STRA|nr:unnamed protein product [Phytophthora fragariaefolia]
MFRSAKRSAMTANNGMSMTKQVTQYPINANRGYKSDGELRDSKRKPSNQPNGFHVCNNKQLHGYTTPTTTVAAINTNAALALKDNGSATAKPTPCATSRASPTVNDRGSSLKVAANTVATKTRPPVLSRNLHSASTGLSIPNTVGSITTSTRTFTLSVVTESKTATLSSALTPTEMLVHV